MRLELEFDWLICFRVCDLIDLLHNSVDYGLVLCICVLIVLVCLFTCAFVCYVCIVCFFLFCLLIARRLLCWCIRLLTTCFTCLLLSLLRLRFVVCYYLFSGVCEFVLFGLISCNYFIACYFMCLYSLVCWFGCFGFICLCLWFCILLVLGVWLY